jgi:TP901 family phage tail tape measure protein
VAAGSLFLDIVPRILGLTAEMQKSAVAPAEAAGVEAGTGFSSAFTRSVTAGTSGVSAAVQAQVRAAQGAVEQASVAISAARDKELAAADRVRIAETKLAEARAKYAGDSSQVIAAEARVEAAKRNQVTASEKVTLAEANEGRAKTDLIAKNDALTASEAKAGEAAAAAGAKTDAAAASTQAAFAKLALGTAAAGAIIGVDAVYQAGNFQQSLTKLATTAGESQDAIDGVGQGILDMAGQVGTSAQDLAKAMYVVDSSGIHGADSLTVLKAAAQGAAQEQADLGHVTDAVTTALHDYHLPASDAALVTSQLVTAVSHGKTTFDELTGAMHSVTPIASAAGISLAEAAGALSAMTASGMSADQAAQNLGSTIKSLSAPTQPVIKELAALGLNSVELSKNLGTNGVAGTLQQVSTAIMEKMGPAGTTLLETMNQSKLAGVDANKMYAAMAPEVRKVADELVNGTITSRQFATGTGHLNAAMQAQGRQWLTQYKNANSFSQILKSGGNDTQTYMEALKRATGTQDGMSVALQVTGENAAATNAAIRDIAGATTQADGSIKGWDEVQGNFNQRLHEVIDGIKSWIIELGQRLLPSVTAFLAVLQDTAGWMSDHATLLKAIGAAILVAVTAFAIYETTVKTVTAVTKAWTVATGLLNGTMVLNPIGLVVVAIAALVAGVIYAYTHFDTFRNIVDAAWSGISNAFKGAWSFISGVFGDFQSGWNALKYTFSGAGADMVADGGIIGAMAKFGEVARNVITWVRDHFELLKNVFLTAIGPIGWIIEAFLHWHDIMGFLGERLAAFTSAMSTGWAQVGAFFNAIWTSVIKPTFDAVSAAFQAVGSFFMATWNNFLHPVFELFGAIVMAAWNDFIKPALGMISTGWHDFADTMRQTYDTVVDAIFKAFGVVVDWVWKNVIKPTFDAITAAINFVSSVFHTVLDAMSTAWHAYADFMRQTYDTVVNAVFEAFKTAINWLWTNAIKPALDLILDGWTRLSNSISNVWNNILKPVLDFVGTAIKDDLVGKFNDGVSLIQTAWEKLKDIVKAPIKFVVETVLNNGLIAGFNDLAGFFGTDKITPIPLPQGFATGGAVWGAGSDTSDSILARLSNDEHVLTAREVRGLGGHGAVEELRSMARNGMLGYANGGQVIPGYSIGGAISGAASSVGNALSSAVGAISDPVGTIRKAVESLYGGIGDVAASGLGKMVLGAPKKLLESALAKIQGLFGFGGGGGNANVGGGSGAIPTGAHLDLINAALSADGIPQGDWPRWQAGMDTLIGRESGWNPGAVNNWDSNAAAGIPSGGLTQTILPTFNSNRNASLSANMFDPVANIAASINYIRSRYGDISAVQQANPSMPPKGYDDGGWLNPGDTGRNFSTKPEPVFSSAQWDVLRKNVDAQGGNSGAFTDQQVRQLVHAIGQVAPGVTDGLNGVARSAYAAQRG